jgi:hypothetical protein
MSEPRWDPSQPLPPDEGQGHTHTASGISLSLREVGVDSALPEGEWYVVLTLSTQVDLPAGHAIAHAMKAEEADKLGRLLVQAAGDLSRVDR